MTIQPLVLEPEESGSDGDLLTDRDLVLHGDMQRGMQQGIGQIHSGLLVILHDQADGVVFTERPPLGRIGRDHRIV